MKIFLAALALLIGGCTVQAPQVASSPEDAPREPSPALMTAAAEPLPEEPCVEPAQGVRLLSFALNHVEQTIQLPTGEVYRFTGERNVRLARLKPSCGVLFPPLPNELPTGFRRYTQTQLLSDIERLDATAPIWAESGIDKDQFRQIPRESYEEFAAAMSSDPLGAER